MIYPKTYAVFDFETTGLDTMRDNPTEIAVKLVIDGVPQEPVSWLVQPGFPINAEAARITGITEEMCATEGLPLKDAIEKLAKMVEGFPLVGHNIMRYDNVIFNRLLMKFGITIPLGLYEFADTAAMYKAVKLGPDAMQRWCESHADFCKRIMGTHSYQKFNLAFACNDLGIDLSDVPSHRAAGDVEATYRLFNKLTTAKPIHVPGYAENK